MHPRFSLRHPWSPILLAAGLIGAASVASAQTDRADGADDEGPLLAPFVSRALVETIVEDLERQEIERERIDAVYLDPDTGFLWATDDNGRDIDWHRAATFCDALVLAGYDDWALPSLDELETLLRPMAPGAYNLPPKIQLTACCPWSSTRKDEKSAWNFNFQFSKPFSGAFSYTYDHRALCMRTPLEDERVLIEALQKEARKK